MAQPPQTRTVRKKGQAPMRMQGMPGPNRQVREMCSPQQCCEVALYRNSTQGSSQQAELSGAASAGEETDNGAVGFR
jgi:hypothetical protein